MSKDEVIVFQAAEICRLQKELLAAISSRDFWMDEATKKPTGAANTDEPMDG